MSRRRRGACVLAGVPSSLNIGSWEIAVGPKKSKRPLSINTGIFTRGAKFTGSASGSDGCRLKPPKTDHAERDPRLDREEKRRHLCAPAVTEVSDLVLGDIGTAFEIIDRAPHVLRPHDHVIAVAGRHVG